MHKILIRRATLEDLDELALLFDGYRMFYGQESDHPSARDFLEERLQKDESVIFIAMINDSYVGFTQLYPMFSSVSMARLLVLNDLYVYPSHRNQKIASSLMLRAQEYAQEINAKGLTLETGKDNPAQHLYEKLGWIKDEEYLHYFINVKPKEKK